LDSAGFRRRLRGRNGSHRGNAVDHGAIRRLSSAAGGLGFADFRRRLLGRFCVFCVICGLFSSACSAGSGGFFSGGCAWSSGRSLPTSSANGKPPSRQASKPKLPFALPPARPGAARGCGRVRSGSWRGPVSAWRSPLC